MHHYYAVFLIVQRKFEEAEYECREAIKLYPNKSYCHWRLWNILKRVNRIEERLEELQRALELDPNNMRARGDYFEHHHLEYQPKYHLLPIHEQVRYQIQGHDW